MYCMFIDQGSGTAPTCGAVCASGERSSRARLAFPSARKPATLVPIVFESKTLTLNSNMMTEEKAKRQKGKKEVIILGVIYGSLV